MNIQAEFQKVLLTFSESMSESKFEYPQNCKKKILLTELVLINPNLMLECSLDS